MLSFAGMKSSCPADRTIAAARSRTIRVRRWPARLWLLLVLVAGALLPADAHAHQRLVRTEPARDAVLDTVPRELRLTFAEPVQLAFTRVELSGPDGVPVALGEPRLAADAGNVLVLPVAGALQACAYTLVWATASRDGHPVRGEFGFAIAPDAEGLALEPAVAPLPDEAAPPPIPAAPGVAFSAESPAYVAVRWVLYVAMLGVLGAVAFGVLVLGLAGRRERAAGPELVRPARRRAAGVGLAFAALLALAALARLYAQSLAVHGPGAATDPLRLGHLLTETVWGWGWMLQLAAVLLAAAGFAVARRGSPAGWALAGFAALALAVTPALSGHAAAMTGGWGIAAIVADALHVLAAGAWLGCLLVLLLAGIPAAVRLGEGRRGEGVAALVRSFSPTALGFAGVLVLTGVFATWLHGGSVSALLASDYGRLLLLKLGVFALVLAAGAYNFRRILPALGEDAATARLRRSAALELTAGAVVLLITAVLVATARPYEG
jgi:putative copper export protein/methionine-rich copper-binding protein CopC